MNAKRGLTSGAVILIAATVFFGCKDKSGATLEVSEGLTRTRLDVCTSLLGQYDPSGSLFGIEGTPSQPAVYLYTGGTSHPQVGAPGDVTLSAGGRHTGAVLNTAHVFQAIVRVPDVKALMAQIPDESWLQAPAGTGGRWTDPTTGLPLLVLLDGWTNPIIYVPSGGMTGVHVGGAVKTITAVDGRPFWASAGPDGNFQTGDDNFYSTPVIYR